MLKPFEIDENILRKKTNNLLNRNLFEIYLANYKDLCSFGSTDIILKSKNKSNNLLFLPQIVVT